MKHCARRLICIMTAFMLFCSSALAYTKLEKGDKNSDVLAMQKALKALGYSIATDGSYGLATENIVKSFQRAHGLTADGIAGNQTLSLLYSLAGAASGGNNDSSVQETTPPPSGSSAPSTANGQTATVTTESGSLNLRFSADSSAQIIGYIPNGAQITVYSYNNSWYYTIYNNVGGYVMAKFLSFGPSQPQTIAPTSTPKPQTGNGVSGVTATVITTGGSLNLRRNPSGGNNIIAFIPNGARVTVINRGSEWCMVAYNGVSGYVMSEFLSFVSVTPSPAPTAVPSPTPVINNNPTGVTATVITTGGSLNMRSKPSGGTNIIETIPNGAKVLVTARGDTWSAVYYNGLHGYVMSSFLSFVTATQTPAPTPVVITPAPTAAPNHAPSAGTTATIYTGNGSLNFRRTPATGNNIIDTIPDGAQVQVLDKGNVWSAVIYKGVAGYVMTSYLRFSAAATATPTPAPLPVITPAPAAPSAGTVAFVRTTGGSLNLRAKGESGATVIGKIPNGAQILVTERGATWCAVIYQQQVGFVMTSFLTFPVATAAPAITPTPTPAPLPPAASGQLIACVTTSGGSLNMRDNPSTSGNVIAYIPNGMGITVTQRGEAWCAVNYDGISGYVMTSFLTFLTVNTATPTPTPESSNSGSQVSSYALVTTSGGTLNLRSEMSTTSKILCAVANGETLLVHSKGDTWCQVSYAGTSGFVMTKYLTFTATPILPDDGNSDEPSDPSQYKRTLKKGMIGADVDWVQNRLIELRYTLTATGTYDDQTIEAVKTFQSQNGLSTDGLAGSQTFSMLRSSNARKADDPPLNYDTLRVDDQGPAVTSMQKALKELGYNVTVNGDYDAATHNAVVAFQQRNSLVISGIADSLTRQIIHSENAKPYSTPVETLPPDAGVIAGPSLSELKLLHWQNEIKPNVKTGQTYLIFDPNTGISWNLKFYALGRHADSQPATWRDTQLMNRSFGSSSWTVHPVYVLLPTGQWTMATMHNMPHLYGSINDNGFGGHLCVHFLRDMAEAKRNDPNYGVKNQETLRRAWKALTGETIN